MIYLFISMCIYTHIFSKIVGLKKITSFYTYHFLQLFDRLRNKRPHCFEKLIPLKDDIEVEGLGLSSADRNTLIEKVSIIFHVAANVTFDNTLKKAIFINLRATRDICVLGECLKNLAVSNRRNIEMMYFSPENSVRLITIKNNSSQILTH